MGAGKRLLLRGDRRKRDRHTERETEIEMERDERWPGLLQRVGDSRRQ